MNQVPQLVDSWGRVHTNLRISVTDRCNIRCFYCMPNEDLRFKSRSELLSFEEMERVVRIAVGQGITKIRLTGGEPLIRAELPKLVAKLASIAGLTDIALTTNGILLAEQARALKAAGLKRLNISLDAMREETFRVISRRAGLDRVFAGIAAAQDCGFEKIRLNAVAIHGLTEDEVLPLARFAREQQLELRFIEFMPLDAENRWQHDDVLAGETIRMILESEFGELVVVPRDDLSQPAMEFEYADGLARIGFINPITQPFCATCSRLRLTAEGQVRNCLFSSEEWDARRVLRTGGSDAELAALLQQCVAAKKPGHGIDSPDFVKPERAMYQIGG